ncbi:hypothetical protein [Paenibacillus sp. FSL K6-1230]|uniref:hypothetical protein n=1 Tax=Paenibacillus sp. FSL K6-1230 TaxID=2921603 RepID=UPI0030FBB39F
MLIREASDLLLQHAVAKLGTPTTLKCVSENDKGDQVLLAKPRTRTWFPNKGL